MGNFLQTVKRTYFWVLCPIIVLLACAFWWLGVGKLKAEKEKSLSQISKWFNDASQIKSKDRCPCDAVQQGMNQLISKRRDEVAEAWTRKYLQQTADATGILKWPDAKEFPESDRSEAEKLLASVKDLRPIEKKVPFPVNGDLELVMSQRQLYQEYLQRELPKLAKSIGAVWMVGVDPNNPTSSSEPFSSGEMRRPGEGMGQPGVGMDEPVAEESLVLWNPANQAELVQRHFQWNDVAMPMSVGPGTRRAEYGGSTASGEGRPPKILEILYAQEDLWVLQAVLKVIARANEGATGRFNAAIKEIEFIRLGQDAIQSAGMIDRDFGSSGPEGEVGIPGQEQGREGGTPLSMQAGPPPGREGGGGQDWERQSRMREAGGQEGEPGAEGGQGGFMGPDPATGRYVDAKYQALDPTKLRDVMTKSAEVPPAPEEAYLAVAKRVPVRLRVKIDQRKLYAFLIQCANSELTIEVRQLRVNPTDSLSMMMGGNGMMSPSGPGPGYGMRVEGGGEMRRPGEGRSPYGQSPYGQTFDGGGGFGGEGMSGLDEQSRTDLTVEIYGIVYIYNPVDPVILGAPAEGAPTDAVAGT